MFWRVFCVISLMLDPLSAHAWDTYVGRNISATMERLTYGNLLAVKDGNKGLSISLYGIGIPSSRQPFGFTAHTWLGNNLPRGSKLTLTTVNEDKEGVISALVQKADKSINNALVAEGLAWVDRRTCKAIFCRRWQMEENKAREKRKGIWSLNMATPPWQWGDARK